MSRESVDRHEPTTADIAAVDRSADSADRADPVDREVAIPREDTRAEPTGRQTAVRLLPADATDELRRRWTEVQTGFVDAPRAAVQDADTLVADAIRQLAAAFADAKSDLEREWDRGDDVSTETLRLALQRYRTFFDRLLQV